MTNEQEDLTRALAEEGFTTTLMLLREALAEFERAYARLIGKPPIAGRASYPWSKCHCSHVAESHYGSWCAECQTHHTFSEVAPAPNPPRVPPEVEQK